MQRQRLMQGVAVLFFSLLAYFFVPSTQTSPVSPGFVLVTHVVDGDTFDVEEAGKTQRVRVLGINTPETVDPRKTVECFGKEASDKAKSILAGTSVRLESDPSQDDVDKYGRLLRHVFLQDGTDFGLSMISQGYAYEYTYRVPSPQFHEAYAEAQAAAQAAGLGLWGKSTCDGKK